MIAAAIIIARHTFCNQEPNCCNNLRAIKSIPVQNYKKYSGAYVVSLLAILHGLLPHAIGMAQVDQPAPLQAQHVTPTTTPLSAPVPAPITDQITAPVTAPITVKAELTGLSTKLHERVFTHISTPVVIAEADLLSHAETLQKKTASALKAYGYYDAQISTRHAHYKNHATVALNVDPGQPIRIREIDIKLNDDAAMLKEFKQTFRELSLVKGDAFDHEVYENAKRSLLKTAQLLGFFDAQFARSQVLVTRSDKTADIFLELDTGTRYTITQVVYNQELYPDNFIRRWQNFETSVPYRASYVSDLTVNLQKSGYFKRVRVVPDLQLAVEHNIPLIVELEPVDENTVSFGVGYATDTGPRLKSNWMRPHTNSLGHTLESNASVSNMRQDLSLSYRIPNRKRPATNSYTFDAGLLNHETDDTSSQLTTIEIAEQRLTRKKWNREFFLRLENENFTVGNDENSINLLLPGISFSKAVSRGGINPDKGRFFSFQLMGARQSLFSDINMLRATAAAKFLHSWNRKHFFITRAELGALRTESFEQVPTTHRFFAGGDNSVRGYGYQEISPLNEDNEAIGGQFLTTASLEYNHYFTEKFAVAAFLDSGRAFIENNDDVFTGLGIGLRWRSPVGPLRLDFAHGIDNDDSPYRIHLAIGPEL